MNKAIIGKKLGMTQIFSPDGKVIPVTVVEAGPCPVVQIKTKERDGYEAVKVGFGKVEEKNLNKPQAGQFKKAGVEPQKVLKEFKFDDVSAYAVGSVITVDTFAEGDKVDVVGYTKGHGFSGVIQKWNQHRLPMTHGTGPVHREVGSLGANSTPSRVFKNHKMPGDWGDEKVTIQNLEVAKVDADRNLILIKGAIPGAKGSVVTICSAVKA
jgi:large subunit ribosomal protein L3